MMQLQAQAQAQARGLAILHAQTEAYARALAVQAQVDAKIQADALAAQQAAVLIHQTPQLAQVEELPESPAITPSEPELEPIRFLLDISDVDEPESPREIETGEGELETIPLDLESPLPIDTLQARVLEVFNQRAEVPDSPKERDEEFEIIQWSQTSPRGFLTLLGAGTPAEHFLLYDGGIYEVGSTLKSPGSPKSE
jgi:hypothetical protein